VCIARIGETGEVEVVVVGVSERLIQCAGQGFGGDELSVVCVCNRILSVGDRAHFGAAEIGKVYISLRRLYLYEAGFIVDVVDLIS